MVVRAVTQSDLNNLEKSIKLDITKEQADFRHEDRKKLSTYYFKIDELEKSVAVNENILKNMSDNFLELKNMVKEGFSEIKQEIKGMDTRFSTKEEYNANMMNIQELKETHRKIMSWIVGSVGTVFIAFLGLVIKTLWLK